MKDPSLLLCLILIILKNVNDTYGHDVGDFVLKELSSIVSERTRQSDVFARWGGEEFMILLTESSLEDAIEKAEVIRVLIEGHNFSPVPQVTCSFGVINTDHNDHSTIDILTKFVDEALYYAKTSGRNKVVSYHEMINK